MKKHDGRIHPNPFALTIAQAALLSATWCALPAAAQSGEGAPVAAPASGSMPALASPPAPLLNEITIKGQSSATSRNQPYSVYTFDGGEIRDRQINQPEQLFRDVPGMEVRGLGYGGVANSFVLRGFAGGGHGGDIGFVIDGIPLNEASSHADGYADLNVVVPLELESMQVFRGPVSALYGNYNRAGVVALESRKGGTYRDADIKLGSWGTLDAQMAAGGQLGSATLNAAAQLFRTDSWREQSGNWRGTFALRSAWDISSSTQVALSTRLHRARADTASVISEAQFNDRAAFDRKNPNVQNDSAEKTFGTLRADIAHTLAPGLRVLGFVYGTQQTFRRSFTRPTSAGALGLTWQQREENYDRDVWGAGVNLNGEHAPLGRTLRWVAGIERYEEDTAYRYADALANGAFTAATLTAGLNGGSGTLDRNLQTRSTALFAQGEWALDPLFRPSAGVRHDRIGGGCRARGLETRVGASAQCAGDMQQFEITTPKIGVRSTWLPGLLEARASLAEGFALPGDAAKFTSGLSVEPTTFRQRELGFTLTPGTAWLIDVVHFRTDSRDEVALVVPATLTYANIGRTRREGVEAEVRFAPSRFFEATAALASVRTEVLQTLPATPWLAGAQITGVPRRLATVSATVRPGSGYAVTAVARSVGRYAVTQPGATSAAQYYDGYRTVDLMATYETGSNTRRHRYFVQIANLADRRYATSVGVTGAARTYNPAPPRTLTVGTSMQF